VLFKATQPAFVIVETFFVITSKCRDLLKDQRHASVHHAGTFVDTPKRTNASNNRGRDQWRNERIHSCDLLVSVYRRRLPRISLTTQDYDSSAVVVTVCFACCFKCFFNFSPVF
jgi:hypothetical protein